MKRLALCLLFLGVVACGADGAGDDDIVGDGGVGPDAPASVCDIGVTWMPTMPTAGETIVASSSIPDDSGGFHDYTWTVRHDSADVDYSPAAMGGSRIMFDAADPGPYFITLHVSESLCNDFDGAINVRVPGATDSPWRLRFTAPPSFAIPPQERTIVVPSAADFDYGTVSLDQGAITSGTLVDGNGDPVPGYLRLTPAGTPDLVLDAFAGTTGAFAIHSTLGPHDLLVIPLVPGLAPRGFDSWTPVPGNITVDAGTAVSGTVLDPSGVGLVGATVTIRVNGVPSTAAITTAGGAFTVRARPSTGALVTVDVVPPDGSGLPRLASSPAVLDLGMSVAITYQPLTLRDVGGAAVTLGGSAGANAKVTFVGAIAGAGVVATGLTQAGAAGTVAIDVTASGAGVLPTALVPAIATEAVVHLAASWGEVDVDLTTVSPAAITAPGAATISGRAVDPLHAAVDTASLRVIPTGALAAAGALDRSVPVAADGTFTTLLPGGGDFELVFTDRSGDLALLRSAISVTGNANLGDLELPEGLSLSGKVALSGGSGIGIAVTMFCSGCDPADEARPAAEAATDSGGRYRATVLDPGVP